MLDYSFSTFVTFSFTGRYDAFSIRRTFCVRAGVIARRWIYRMVGLPAVSFGGHQQNQAAPANMLVPQSDKSMNLTCS
jgi:hypothetical protein